MSYDSNSTAPSSSTPSTSVASTPPPVLSSSPSEATQTKPLPPTTDDRTDREATPTASAPAPKQEGREREKKSASSGKKSRHRRGSSSHRVKETLDAVSTQGPEGRRTVNQYTLGPELGKGAFGTVELGVDLQTGEKYAVKEYSKARLRRQVRQRSMAAARGRGIARPGQTSMRELEEQADKNPLSLIAREVAIMKKLDHPNLVHLYEVLDVPLSDGLFMVLEYCPGGILLELPQPPEPPNEPMGLFRARHYFGQILMGLEYLHENDVVHRDIKPENILLTVDKQTAKMCDFGVSEMFAKKGEDKVRKGQGSPAFMSPESIEGGTEIEAKPADVWALGVTLYCMLSGHLPFAHDNPVELYESIKTQEIELPEDWHQDQKDLITGMLDRDPEKRLTVEQIRNHAWLVPADLPSKEENLSDDRMVVEPTADEISKAVRSVSSAFAVIRAVQKFKRLTASKRSSRASTMDSSVFSEDGSSPSASPHPSPRPSNAPLQVPSDSPSKAGPSRSASPSSNSLLAPPPMNEEPVEISDEPATFDEPEELAEQFYTPHTPSRPKSPNEQSLRSNEKAKHPGIADEMSDEPASMEDGEEEADVQGSQETAKPERPKLGLQVPSGGPNGLSERFSKMGCVIVESPGGGREEIS